MEISIYHTALGNLIPSAVRLLEKIYISEKRCVFFSPVEDRVGAVDKTLWTFSTNAFIPHGDKKLGFCDKQPIYFTSLAGENPNNSVVLFAVDDFDLQLWMEHNFEKVIFMFEDESQMDAVRSLHASLQKRKEDVNYWKQSSKGWEKCRCS